MLISGGVWEDFELGVDLCAALLGLCFPNGRILHLGMPWDAFGRLGMPLDALGYLETS